MASIMLYKGAKSDANIINYQCASFDFENAVIDQDYQIRNQITGTMPTTGEELKQIRIHITTAGINYLSGYAESSSSEQNLVLPPAYDVGDGTESTPYGISEAKLITIGERPADWELHYMDKYFTKNISSVSGVYYANYSSAGTARSGVYYPTWDKNTQYYEVPNFAQIFYTGATGFFGVSRSLIPTADGISESVNVLYNRRPFGTGGNYYPGEFWWKANGAFGTALFGQPYATADNVMIRMTSTQSNPLNSYQSRLLVQMIRFDYEEETYTGIVAISLSADDLPQRAEITALSAPFWKEETTPASSGETSYSQGGHGAFSGPSNDRGDRNGSGIATRVANWNSLSAFQSANQNRYCLLPGADNAALYQVINRLWSPSFWESFANNFFNPRDAIVTCHFMPYALGPKYSSNKSVIKAAEINLSTDQVHLFSNTYTDYHVGDLDITDPRWYEGFPDFDNTAIYIHLPYIGVKQIDVEAVMEGVLSVDYVSDVQTGDLVATVWTQDRFGHCNYRYEFKGTCAQVLPLSARDATVGTQVASTVLSTVGRVAIAAATGGISELVGGLSGLYGAQGNLSGAGQLFMNGIQNDMVGGALKGVGSGLNSLANSVSAANSGVATIASNAQGGPATTPIDTQCYLIIARSKWSNPENYAEQFGYPSDIGGTINGKPFEGFLSCRTIVLNGLTATDAERSEIAALMASGVYV